MKVDFGIPQLFPPESNLGIAMYILKHYKSDIFSTSVGDTANPVGTYTDTPTAHPTVTPTRRFTAIPTVSPTASPTYTSAPTHTSSPTLAPTFAPTEPPVQSPKRAKHTDFISNFSIIMLFPCIYSYIYFIFL